MKNMIFSEDEARCVVEVLKEKSGAIHDFLQKVNDCGVGGVRGGRQNLLNKQELEEVLSDQLCQCDLSLGDSFQLLCACLACSSELSDAFVLPSAMPGVALATWEEQAWPWRARNKAGMLLLARVCWHREGWLVTFWSDLSQLCK